MEHDKRKSVSLREDEVLVPLDEDEVSSAAHEGARRYIKCMFAKKHPPEHDNWFGEPNWNVQIESAGAELAVAKSINRYWIGCGKKTRYDVSRKINVRHSLKNSRELIIEYDDPDDSMMVLVVGKAPKYCVVGWIMFKDGLQIGERKEPPKCIRSSCWVPQQELNPWPPTAEDRVRIVDALGQASDG